MDLQPLDRLQVIDQPHGRMPEWLTEAAAADRPEGIGLGDGTDRLDGLGHDPIDQGIGEPHGLGQPGAKSVRLAAGDGKLRNDL